MKVWLGGCGPFKYIETMLPYKILTDKDLAEEYINSDKKYQHYYVEHAKKQGYPDPRVIPWNKVDKVLHREYDIQHKKWHVIEGTH